MKIMIAGDTHGNFLHLMDLIEEAESHEIKTIMQLGDFGYWEHTPEGLFFLEELNHQLMKRSITLHWLCGNHDNHPMLWDTYGHRSVNMVRQNIIYHARGGTCFLDQTPVMTLGGAFSIDVDQRRKWMKQGTPECWWETEMLTEDQVADALVAGTVCPPVIMFTHDAPEGAPINKLANLRLSAILEAKSQENRIKVRRVVDALEPQYLFHGHFHTRLEYDLRTSDGHVVECLSLGSDPDGRGRNVRSLTGELNDKGQVLFEESYEILDLDTVDPFIKGSTPPDDRTNV